MSATPATIWTPDHIGILRQLWAERNLSCQGIADALGAGFTRNAVIGKVHRLKLETRPKAPAAAPKPRAPRPAPAPRPKWAKPKPAPKPVPVAPPSGSHCDIMALRKGRCRWPMWSTGSERKLYCGASCDPAAAYCPYHARRSIASAVHVGAAA